MGAQEDQGAGHAAKVEVQPGRRGRLSFDALDPPERHAVRRLRNGRTQRGQKGRLKVSTVSPVFRNFYIRKSINLHGGACGTTPANRQVSCSQNDACVRCLNRSASVLAKKK